MFRQVLRLQTNKKETLQTDYWSPKIKFVCFLVNLFTATNFAFLVLFPSKNGLKKRLSSLKMRLQRTLIKVRIRLELELKPYSKIYAGPKHFAIDHDLLRTEMYHDVLRTRMYHDLLRTEIYHDVLRTGICHNALRTGICHDVIRKGICHDVIRTGMCNDVLWTGM